MPRKIWFVSTVSERFLKDVPSFSPTRPERKWRESDKAWEARKEAHRRAKGATLEGDKQRYLTALAKFSEKYGVSASFKFKPLT